MGHSRWPNVTVELVMTDAWGTCTNPRLLDFSGSNRSPDQLVLSQVASEWVPYITPIYSPCKEF